MKRYCYIFPGQGAQYVGMGKTFYDSFAESKELFEQADDLLHLNLRKIIFEGPEDLLTQTKIAQPAIFVTSMAILSALQKSIGLPAPCCTAGLSLGEYSALASANVFSFEEGLNLVSIRGKLMHEACEATKGSMVVVLGLEDAQVIQAVKEINLPHDLWCANFNSPGQVVISGTIHGLSVAQTVLKSIGAKRLLPLQVHGAFHSGLMQTAATSFAPYLEQTQFAPSKVPVAMNTIGKFSSEQEYKDLLKKQITSSVLWHSCISSCAQKEIDAFIEIGCGTTLAGLNKRIGVEIPTISIDTTDSLKLLQQ